MVDPAIAAVPTGMKGRLAADRERHSAALQEADARPLPPPAELGHQENKKRKEEPDWLFASVALFWMVSLFHPFKNQ